MRFNDDGAVTAWSGELSCVACGTTNSALLGNDNIANVVWLDDSIQRVYQQDTWK
jgi:hypothetical protein